MAQTLLLDSASLYFRAYHALPSSMTAPDGRPHGAVRGFLQTVTRLLERFPTQSLACCWDQDWRPQWRVDLLGSYKAHRVATEGDEEVPDDLAPQAQALAELLDALGIARPAAVGFEADDCIGTLAARATGPVVVVSGDRDMVQLVGERVRVLLAVNGGMDRWPLLDPQSVRDRFQVDPGQYRDLAVLRGDPSDGIPGVPGIGEKTAARLLAEAGSIMGIWDALALDQRPAWITERQAKTLHDHRDLVTRMQAVAAIRTDVPWTGTLAAPAHPRDEARLHAIAAAWGVQRQVADLRNALSAASSPAGA